MRHRESRQSTVWLHPKPRESPLAAPEGCPCAARQGRRANWQQPGLRRFNLSTFDGAQLVAKIGSRFARPTLSWASGKTTVFSDSRRSSRASVTSTEAPSPRRLPNPKNVRFSLSARPAFGSLSPPEDPIPPKPMGIRHAEPRGENRTISPEPLTPHLSVVKQLSRKRDENSGHYRLRLGNPLRICKERRRDYGLAPLIASALNKPC